MLKEREKGQKILKHLSIKTNGLGSKNQQGTKKKSNSSEKQKMH